MHLMIVTFLALAAPPVDQAPHAMPGPESMPYEMAGECDCEACRQRRLGDGTLADKIANRAMMPQTCYNPRFGCYSGNERFMNRYPAFHGHYYRKPYNYRHVFDYPWHADMHEPTSLFSYNVPGDTNRPEPVRPPAAPAAPPAAAKSMPVEPRSVEPNPAAAPLAMQSSSRRITTSSAADANDELESDENLPPVSKPQWIPFQEQPTPAVRRSVQAISAKHRISDDPTDRAGYSSRRLP